MFEVCYWVVCFNCGWEGYHTDTRRVIGIGRAYKEDGVLVVPECYFCPKCKSQAVYDDRKYDETTPWPHLQFY